MIAERDLEQLLPRVDGLGDYEARKLTQALQAEILAKCAQDGLFWLRFVQTRDEADPEQSVKRFPVHLEYIQRLWTVLVDDKPVVIAKSRQMLVSWLVAAFCVWTARFKPHAAVYWQSQQFGDAAKMVAMPMGGYLGRCQFMEDSLPAFLRQDYKAAEGRLSYPNGSMIEALAGGADQIRGKVPTVYVGDEFARMQDGTGVFTAVAPVIQKRSKAIFISTPNGTANQFATIFHGRKLDLDAA